MLKKFASLIGRKKSKRFKLNLLLKKGIEAEDGTVTGEDMSKALKGGALIEVTEGMDTPEQRRELKDIISKDFEEAFGKEFFTERERDLERAAGTREPETVTIRSGLRKNGKTAGLVAEVMDRRRRGNFNRAAEENIRRNMQKKYGGFY